MDILKISGCYVIVYLLKEEVKISIGKLGRNHFFPGIYFYCGSAKGAGGLESRVSRHLNPDTKKFWHIDFLKSFVDPRRVWFSTNNKINECILVRSLERVLGAQSPVPDFGSSDCREKCNAHLLYTNDCCELDSFYRTLKKEIVDLKEEHIFM